MNDSKTEYLILEARYQNAVQGIPTLRNGQSDIPCSSNARNIGAIFDNNMTMVPQLNSVCRSCYYHLRQLGQIRKYITKDAAATLVHAFISSKFDNLNSLLYGIPDKYLKRLQRIQYNAAKLVLHEPKGDDPNHLLRNLHWLPVDRWIVYKIVLLVFKAFHGLAPTYLQDLVQVYEPARALRSSDQNLLQPKSAKLKSYGDKAFSVCGPKLWNMLPQELRLCDNILDFKKPLKTHLFV